MTMRIYLPPRRKTVSHPRRHHCISFHTGGVVQAYPHMLVDVAQGGTVLQLDLGYAGGLPRGVI